LTATYVFAFSTFGIAQQLYVGKSHAALSAENFSTFQRLIRPQPGDYKWEQSPSLTSLRHARRRAAAEEKPIFFFGTGGAGFNDPLGNC
jgi:hypothetical protein